MTDCDVCYEEIKRLKQWVADLQSHEYTTCVYCGHRYGPSISTPASKAQILKDHIMRCPSHPMSDFVRTVINIIETTEAMNLTNAKKISQIRMLAYGVIKRNDYNVNED